MILCNLLKISESVRMSVFKKILAFLKKYDILIKVTNGSIAQLVEHLLDVQGVTGSSPVTPTKTKNRLTSMVGRFFILY